MQGLHVAVNEKKSLPVVIETKNVPVSTLETMKVLSSVWQISLWLRHVSLRAVYGQGLYKL